MCCQSVFLPMNHMGGAMVSLLVWSVVDLGFEPLSG